MWYILLRLCTLLALRISFKMLGPIHHTHFITPISSSDLPTDYFFVDFIPGNHTLSQDTTTLPPALTPTHPPALPSLKHPSLLPTLFYATLRSDLLETFLFFRQCCISKRLPLLGYLMPTWIISCHLYFHTIRYYLLRFCT